VGIYLVVCFVYCYDGYVFIIRLNMGLCVSEKVSFICNLCLLKLCMWNCSSLFSDLALFSVCSISVWLIVPYVCSVSSIC
jgi:ABC-type sugar transport system permease subunit